ncbi:DUF58 domain-containing protein [Pseudoclavibacter albus]|uniref:DUF58 domain-containing protein n=1 Tax=Pseudoclavibacter albus TaxID=272241 RepID=UPI0009F945A6|nr:DUF58 domain-containing protein [Pseudoclavibacter alba]
MTTRTMARRLRPTRRAWGLLVVGLMSVLIAYLIGRQMLLLVGLFLIGLPLLALALRAVFRPKIELERTVFPRTIAVGDRLRVVEELQNRAFISLEPVSYFDLTPGARRSAVGGVLPSIAGRWHPNANKRRRRIAFSLDSLRRGVHDVGPLYLDNVDALGLTRRVIEIGEPVTVQVWPRLHPLDELELPAIRSGGEVETGIALAGDSDDVLTREYRHGDPMRRIHWRATARSGELRVRQEEHHAEVSSIVILDTAPNPEAPARVEDATLFDIMDAAGDDSQAPIDHALEQAVSIAASLVAHLHARGYETELLHTHEWETEREGSASFRTAAEDPIEPVMHHFMGVQPADAASGAEPLLDEIQSRAARIGKAPVFVVHRAMDAEHTAQLSRLGAQATPGVLILVAEGPISLPLQPFLDEGWEVLLVHARARNPWASMTRYPGARTAAKRRASATTVRTGSHTARGDLR